MLDPDGTGFRLPERPPSAAERLGLPDRLATQIEQAAAHARYCWVAADLTLIAAWGHPRPVDDLADRLLIPSDDVPGLLAYAATRYIEPVDGGIVARAQTAWSGLNASSPSRVRTYHRDRRRIVDTTSQNDLAELPHRDPRQPGHLRNARSCRTRAIAPRCP
ncbi:hypothetical protein [Amycolatopsis sp. NPDC004169]|uniref:hypothetical protein n=1 Tax=Amycolatopsis sp. NPDC004169 TaxID=3154453 RepID=UPI0033B8591A